MEITAVFPTIDDAENCARRLKHSCPGIRSIRIRFHSTTEEKGTVFPAVIAASEHPGGPTAPTDTTGVPYAAFALAPEDSHIEKENSQDCTMVVEAEDFCCHEVESILLNEHASRVRSW